MTCPLLERTSRPTRGVLNCSFPPRSLAVETIGGRGLEWTDHFMAGEGRSQKFVLGGIKVFGGWIKLLNSRSDVILPHKKFTWADFFCWGGINTDIHPRRYAPVLWLH